jgi:arsenate reductase
VNDETRQTPPTERPSDGPTAPGGNTGPADIHRQVATIFDATESRVAIEADPLQHPSRPALDRGEQAIKDEVLRMGSLVEEQIRAAIAALERHDADAATAVIVGDARINEAQRAISTLVSTTIATQQPVARDLRFLLSLDHVAFELERIGDHAGSVAKQARKLAPEPPLGRYVHLPRMGELAAELVHGILRALVDIDEAQARQVAARDDVEVHSAGTDPRGVNPRTIEVLTEAGIDPSFARSKSVNEYLGQTFDYVITVCDQARQVCPVFPGVHETLHWGYEDPAEATGTEEEQLAVFRRVFTSMAERIGQFLTLAGKEREKLAAR